MQADALLVIKNLIDVVFHVDRYLADIIRDYGTWTYGLLFLVIFCETGLVITPFLPGDSLLFAAGSLAGLGALNPHLLVLIIASAALVGDNVNYWIGYHIGPKVFSRKIRFLKKEYLDKTHAFYEKHGGKTVILARFIPIIRTFSPFVAGVGRMPYFKFISNSIIASLLWATIFVYAGYFFGSLPFVKNNFSFVIVAIILISVVPIALEFIKSRRNLKKKKADTALNYE